MRTSPEHRTTRIPKGGVTTVYDRPGRRANQQASLVGSIFLQNLQENTMLIIAGRIMYNPEMPQKNQVLYPIHSRVKASPPEFIYSIYSTLVFFIRKMYRRGRRRYRKGPIIVTGFHSCLYHDVRFLMYGDSLPVSSIEQGYCNTK